MPTLRSCLETEAVNGVAGPAPRISFSLRDWLLAMPDMAQLERELMSRHPESWVRHHLASFPREYFQVFEGPELSRHLELLQGLSDDRPVAIHAESEAGGVWKVVVVGYDAFQFLSTLCTLLAVRGLSILEGRVFTSQPPPPEPTTPAPRRAAAAKACPADCPDGGT